MYKKAFSVKLKAIPPYSFELTVHRPAGWWWSTPNEIYENGALWTSVRLNSRLYGLKLEEIGDINKPSITCNVHSAKPLTNKKKTT